MDGVGMENQNPLAQLSSKRRTSEDLSRFLGSRSGGASNYSLLLGAGCSVSSNVRSATSLVEQWRKEIFHRLCPGNAYEQNAAVEYLTKNHAVWYNPQREYSSLFEKNFDLPRQRRMFVEQEVAEKTPNLGYAYLVRLIEEGFVNTVFTTNFDDLINEAFFQFSKTRPLICAHDSSIGSVTVTSKRPKIIKLHGDYLFDDIKATVRETESLEDNIRKKFIEFGRDFGLVVVGYGGGDRSVMDVLQYLLRGDDYFKHGIYWCVRRGERPGDELLKLLWRDRVYFVEIDGFDELMAALHNDLVGQALPIDTGVVTNKPRQIIEGFCKNSFLNDSPSWVIKRDLDRLRKQHDREHLFGFMRQLNPASDDGGSEDSETLNDGELVKLLEVKQLVSSADIDAARSRIVAELATKPSPKLREELSELRVSVEELAGDYSAALAAVDELIADDPNDADNYIRKSLLTNSHDERLKILALAEGVDACNHRLQNRKADCHIEMYESGLRSDRADLLKLVEDCFERSLTFDPSARNGVWGRALDFYANPALAKDYAHQKLDDLVERANSLGRTKLLALRSRLARLARCKEDRKGVLADALLQDISAARLASPKATQPSYEWLELDAYIKLERKEDLSRRISELEVNPELSRHREYLRRKSDFLMSANGDIAGSIGAMRLAVEVEGRSVDIMRLAYLLSVAKDANGFGFFDERRTAKLRPVDRILIKRHECVARGDIEGGLAQLRASFGKRVVGALEKVDEVHDLLLLKRYDEAAAIQKAVLEQLAWNKMEFGEHVVNFELSQARQGIAVNKKRLGEVVETSHNDSVKGCASFLIGDFDKARGLLVGEIRRDKELQYAYGNWAIFHDERGRGFLDGVLKLL